MSDFVTDTHALHWHLARDRRLSATAREIFTQADRREHRIFIPSISLVEMIYLEDRGRLDRGLVTDLLSRLGPEDLSYVVALLDLGTVNSLRLIPRALIPDMPDRIIAATAHQRGIPLITRDGLIRQAGVVTTIW